MDRVITAGGRALDMNVVAAEVWRCPAYSEECVDAYRCADGNEESAAGESAQQGEEREFRDKAVKAVKGD